MTFEHINRERLRIFRSGLKWRGQWKVTDAPVPRAARGCAPCGRTGVSLTALTGARRVRSYGISICRVPLGTTLRLALAFASGGPNGRRTRFVIDILLLRHGFTQCTVTRVLCGASVSRVCHVCVCVCRVRCVCHDSGQCRVWTHITAAVELEAVSTTAQLRASESSRGSGARCLVHPTLQKVESAPGRGIA